MPQRAPIAKPMSPWHTVPQWRRPSFLADEDFWASSSRIGVERVEPPSAQLATVSDLERLQEKSLGRAECSTPKNKEGLGTGSVR
eukprot:g3014.t1